MKIGILTLPSSFNYGGILQALAMQRTLDTLGYDNTIIRRERPIGTMDKLSLARKCKNLVKKILGKPIYTIPTEEQKLVVEAECRKFIEANMRKTCQVAYNTEELEKLCRENAFDTIVVGSDQVWRPHMTANIKNYFLDFCEKDIKKIAYAASFGTDRWEFSDEDTAICSNLAKGFKTITVREDSGITLCKEHLKVEATHVLDPTMLLEPSDYIALANKSNVGPSAGNLFCYILNENKGKSGFINAVSEHTGCTPFTVMPKRDPYFDNNAARHAEESIYPSPAVWIRAFMDAEFVVTDSFHGTVFSIIFNKPFLVVGNKSRGNARFDSLLKLFNLQDRYVDNLKEIDLSSLKAIDWDSVNRIRKEKKETSLHILKKAMAD